MSENELEVEGEEIVEPVESVEGEEDTTDYKALALRNAGIAKRLKTRLEKSKIAEKVEKKVEEALEEQKGFDYAERAYIRSEGIVGDELRLVEDWVKDTGKKIEDVILNTRFQSELKDFRDNKASKEAIPSGSKRSSTSAKDETAYWVAKGEMPENTPENRELRQKIVNAKIKEKGSGDVFTKNSVMK